MSDDRFKVFLDAGHGLHTPKKKTPNGISEWSLNDKVCKYIKANLMCYNCDVYRCDDITGEEDIFPIGKRLEVADIGGANVCISIHHNLIGDGSFHDGESVSGVEVFIHNDHSINSKNLASMILDNMVNYTELPNRGLKIAKLTMCEKRDYPTILCEGGFMNNHDDCNYICSPDGQRRYAAAVSDAIIKYFRLKYDPASEANVQAEAHHYKVSDLPNDTVNCKLETDSLAAAMSECDNYYGYKVYDENNNVVYESVKQRTGDAALEKYANIRKEGVPMRAKPDSLSQPVHTLEYNEEVYIIDKYDEPFWNCRTSDGAFRGYVYSEHLKKIN